MMFEQFMQAAVYGAIGRERAYQDGKYPSRRTIGEHLIILRNELAEAERAWMRNPADPAVLAEVLQVAAVAVRCLELYGLVERGPEPDDAP